MNIYFIFGVVIQYHFILLFKLFQLCPLGALSVGFCVPFFSLVLSLSLFSGPTRGSRFILHTCFLLVENIWLPAVVPLKRFALNLWVSLRVDVVKKPTLTGLLWKQNCSLLTEKVAPDPHVTVCGCEGRWHRQAGDWTENYPKEIAAQDHFSSWDQVLFSQAQRIDHSQLGATT